MRWALSEGALVEIWKGTLLLGTLSGETVRQLVAQHLSTAALVTSVREALDAPDSERPRSPARFPPRPLPNKDMLDASQKAARKQARRARAKKRLAVWLLAAWVGGSLGLLGWDCLTDRLAAAPRVPAPVVRRMP